ncbi:MAG: GGDEF domain-containing protein [Spirochaetes bacterium]|nr:MAG: GGDEF domain-containing protein [Spirochaetota bacterium]
MTALPKSFPVFSGLTDAELKTLGSYFTARTCEKGEIVLSRNEMNEDLLIVAHGKIISTAALPGSMERKRHEYRPGDFFGEISLFGKKPALSAYQAAEKSVLLTVPESELRAFIEEHHEAGVRFISSLLSLTVRHLRDSSNFLADIVQWGEEASRRVITDELTGVYNREFLDDAMESFFSISVNNGKPLALLMIDIDHFREINEGLGLDTGNAVLLEIVLIIKGVIQDHGILARYGGDEFSVLLPEANLDRAHAIAEKIRAGVEGHDFSKQLAGGSAALSASIGISAYPETASEFEHFKEKADVSLYRAKELGRNRVVNVD